MVKTFTAFTCEIDDVGAAVREILEGLNLAANLKKNAVGLINCHSDFIESGVVAALCSKLPFETVGTTTIACSCPGKIDRALLTVCVLTSDEIVFSTALTESISQEQEETIRRAYSPALAKLGARPKMALAYAPLLNHVSGDRILSVMDRVTGELPVFGTVSVDHTIDYHTSQVIHNGKVSSDCMAFALIGGDIEPEFFVVNISESRIVKQKAIITASDGSLLKEVNGMPVLRYFETLGISEKDIISGANVIPFVIDYNDGTDPITRAIFALTPEGYAVCGGEMPVNSTLSIGSIDHSDVNATSMSIAKTIAALNPSGVLLFSCVARYYVQGFDNLSEMSNIAGELDGVVEYQLCYSGGELCPMRTAAGKLFNRVHNDTLIICAFK